MVTRDDLEHLVKNRGQEAVGAAVVKIPDEDVRPALMLMVMIYQKSVMLYAAGNRRHDDRGTMTIAYVILNNQHRSDASLLGAAYRFKIRIEYVSAVCGVDVVIIHSSFHFSPATN